MLLGGGADLDSLTPFDCFSHDLFHEGAVFSGAHSHVLNIALREAFYPQEHRQAQIPSNTAVPFFRAPGTVRAAPWHSRWPQQAHTHLWDLGRERGLKPNHMSSGDGCTRKKGQSARNHR